MLLCSPDWSFTGREQARQADFGGRWQGMVGEQTSEPVSGAEEVGPQVARRHAWVGALALVRCQQWHFLTMAIHKQASQQRCSVPGGMKNRPWVGFYSKGGGDVWDTHALNMTQTHFLINALIKISFCLILFLLSHTHTHTNTPPLSHQTKKSHSHLAFVFNGKRYNWRFFSGQMTLQTSRVFISCDGILTPGCSC